MTLFMIEEEPEGWQKYIYFEGNGNMEVIYIIGTWGDGKLKEFRGSSSIKDFKDRRFQFYPTRRCQPYSSELWDACMRWCSKRDLLRAEYEELMKKGVKNGP